MSGVLSLMTTDHFMLKYDLSLTLNIWKIKTIAIIAEGIPENKTKKLNALAAERGVTIIGPATVGGIKVNL